MSFLGYNSDNIIELKKRLEGGKELVQCDTNELKYVTKPIGKSIYKTAKEIKEEPKPKRRKWDSAERIECDLCGREYRRSGRAQHNKTMVHQAYKSINDRLKELMLK